MHIPDLSRYRFPNEPSCLTIGWLDGTHPFPQGNVPSLFVERLWAFCKKPVHGMLGTHECELCPPIAIGQIIEPDRFGDERLYLGSAELRVFGKENKVYAAPNLIYHYVTRHGYCPPDEFIQAVLECPPPDTPTYQMRTSVFEGKPTVS